MPGWILVNTSGKNKSQMLWQEDGKGICQRPLVSAVPPVVWVKRKERPGGSDRVVYFKNALGFRLGKT